MNVLKIGKKTFELDKGIVIAGVLNVTPDSFSDGGKYLSVDKAVKHALSMEKQGADIIDIGGESTRPGAKTITLDEEMNRVIPVIEELVRKINVPISIDTYKSKIVEKALDAGACMVNDVTALQGDKRLVNIVAEYEVPICLMHMKGNPRNMQINPTYDDVMEEIYLFLKERTERAMFYDVKKENIIVDPGIGFGKRTGGGVEDNCKILHRLSELKTLGFPVLVGTSRKTFIGNVCGGKESLPATERLEGSLAAACLAAYNGANIIRVHDVKETRRCLDLVDCVVR
ncbi:MAG: dihydropteroate synthase [Candidatus Thermoplasmatota archaeon]|nr:dihydropteroate synthase [Candidatus Thermoplasmatota archaeon]